MSKGLDVYYSVLRELNMFYVDTIQPEQLIKSSIDEMLKGLDPYTTYISETDMNDFKFATTGEYGGIGALIAQRDDYVIISDPYEGNPAEESGLKAGDKLIEANGNDLKAKKVSDVSDILKGTPGTELHLKVERYGAKKPINISIERAKIVISPVPVAHMLNDTTGYIRLTSFTDKASKAMLEALLTLKNEGAKSLVLDLRSNPGGLLSEANKIVNLFVPKGQTVVYTKGKVSQWDKVYKATQDPVDTMMPLAILVNSKSASASEIVAGALQDIDRAVILGRRTFGKGLVQTTRSLGYNSQLKLTTAKYYVPSGRCIQALDYSHRNDDGSVGKIPDSLISVFYTKGGREVKDGGGIMPDLEYAYNKPGNITYALIRDYAVFDFATQYYTAHPSIASIKDFHFTDKDYDDFKSFITEKDFTYETNSEDALKALKKMAELESYDALIADEVASLEEKLKHNVAKDLDIFKPEITGLIRMEIAKRYFYQNGGYLEALKDDKWVTKATKLVQSPEKYQSILTAQK
ncbi:MAG: S41 family peptidase [Bacteroidales bacterium]|nr:S41 family peptidase [Bacteroidales bacterium]